MSLSERSESKTPWFVYIVQANTARYYVGITTDPDKRLTKHNAGKGSQFARDHGPVKLLYTSAPFASKSEARKHEIQIKGWTRVKKEQLIGGQWE